MKSLLLLLLFSVSSLWAAIDTIAVDVGISVYKTMPIGVIPFTESGIDDSKIQEKPHETVSRDFSLSGRFDVVPSPRFDLVKFSRARAKFYVTGKLENTASGKWKLSCFLYASQTKALVLGESYTVDASNVRAAVHLFTDKVIHELWGVRGVASTELAWVSKIGGVKQIVAADYDGFNRKQLTSDSTISMMPVWGLGNRDIIYVSFRNGRGQLFRKNLLTRKDTRLFPAFPQTFSPVVNPVSGELLFSSITDGKADLFIGNMDTGKAKRVSFIRASQTSPAWSPRASEILFTSDRGGSPQVFVMGKDGSDVRRLTFMGRYNEQAAWSPDGDRIAYTSMDNGKMNIYTCAIDGSDIVQLTSGAGNNERPTWSPDGMLIAFASDRSGSYQIYIMRKDGSNVTRITNGGENTSPSWSWYPEDTNHTTSKESTK
ncbi:MAG: translocation protein TolB [Fibrobacter sp.]|jgi:TolB protein|nr:translocation protein TolB [Fibrobacter sp.]